MSTPQRPVLQVFLAGLGNVGSEFLTLFAGQQQRLQSYVDLRLVAMFNSQKVVLGNNLPTAAWQENFADAEPYQLSTLVAYCQQLPGEKVLIDITPSLDLALAYTQFIQAGCHIISANKQGVTLPTTEYQFIWQQCREYRRTWLSNATVGAGLPVQRIIQELLDSGDQIQRISGVFSGTLSWLLCQYDASKPFSDFVMEAKALGYTEPDPRDDLSGKDVQRKLLILARELGLTLDLADIQLTPLLPAGLEQGAWAAFWQQRQQLDDAMATLFTQASAAQQVLRYVAELIITPTQISAQVSLQAVAHNAPLAALAPCDNLFAIQSNYYAGNPLVLKGPGAGSVVTAAGVHADLVVLAKQLTNQVLPLAKAH